MIKKTLACALFLGAIVPLSASAEKDDLAQRAIVKFDGAIGVQPLRGGGTPNLVLGVSPAGTPWVIDQLNARVTADGRITVDGRGLLVAGGNTIGSNAGQSVKARLSCGGVFSDTGAPVALDADGDFRIKDVLTPAPASPCVSPVLLIVNAAGVWFAAGIPDLRD